MVPCFPQWTPGVGQLFCTASPGNSYWRICHWSCPRICTFCLVGTESIWRSLLQPSSLVLHKFSYCWSHPPCSLDKSSHQFVPRACKNICPRVRESPLCPRTMIWGNWFPILIGMSDQISQVAGRVTTASPESPRPWVPCFRAWQSMTRMMIATRSALLMLARTNQPQS